MTLPDALAEVVNHNQGPLVVNAGPGSRKTSTLVQRFLRLWAEGLAWPYDIWTVVFNRRAVQDFQARLAEALSRDQTLAAKYKADGIDTTKLPIRTLHSLAWMILRQANAPQGADRPARIVAEDAVRGFLKAARAEVLGPKAAAISLPELERQILGARDQGLTPQAFLARAPASHGHETVAAVMVAYEDRLRTENAWDFAGLVPGAVRLLETEPALLARLQGQIEFLFVDEAQDLNACQWRLIRLLAGLRRNVTLVASEPQEIYSWRGADYAAIRGGIRDSWPGTPELLLDRSWRCTERILRVAAAPLDPARYPELAVRPERPGGEKVQIQVLESDRQEPGWVRDWVQAQHAKGRAWRDIAVLTRTGRQLAPIARALEAAHIPRDLSGRHSLLQQQEVRVALGYLAIACLPEDLAERHLELTLRKPTRGIGDATLKVLRGDHEGVTWSDLRAALSADKPAVKVEVIEQITRYLALVTGLRDLHAAGTRPDELLEQALRLSGYYLYLADQEEDVEAGLNLEALKGQAAEFDDPIAFLRSIDDRLLKAFQADPGQGVQLATLSATKGLEFGAVLIAGCEEGLLPHYRATTEALAEVERRLFYVGATRARDTLRLLACRRRNNRDVPVSRILKCLPLDDVEWRMEGFYVS